MKSDCFYERETSRDPQRRSRRPLISRASPVGATGLTEFGPRNRSGSRFGDQRTVTALRTKPRHPDRVPTDVARIRDVGSWSRSADRRRIPPPLRHEHERRRCGRSSSSAPSTAAILACSAHEVGSISRPQQPPPAATLWSGAVLAGQGVQVDQVDLCEMRGYDYFRSEDPVEAARFVVSDAVALLQTPRRVRIRPRLLSVRRHS